MSAAEIGGVRLALLRAMDAEMIVWRWEFAHTTHMIAKGLLDGTLTDDVINAYPAGTEYPVTLSRAIAEQAGMVFGYDKPVYNTAGWRVNVDAEDVGKGIEALRAIPEADAGVTGTDGEGVWQFYAEHLEDNGLTIEQVRDHMRGLDLAGAARLIVDSNLAR